MGSYIGGLTSILVSAFLTYICVAFFIIMFIGEHDTINKLTVPNTYDDDTRSVNVNQHNFMPFLEIDQQDSGSDIHKFDIWEKDKTTGKEYISYQKL
jgi:hypothetical protein